MSDRIVYNREVMNSLVIACRNAADELDGAQSIINAIRSHEDWTCKEKDQIDEYMNDVKRQIGNITNNQHGFLAAIENVAHKLSESEQGIGKLLQPLEALLAKNIVYEVEVPSVVAKIIGSGLLNGAQAIANGAQAIAAQAVEAAKDSSPINLTDMLKQDLWQLFPQAEMDNWTTIGHIETPDWLKDIGGACFSTPVVKFDELAEAFNASTN